ncbi:MAG TPA: biopolymer transporter Tol [Opitutaceae bacterium]|nr:biopolymer transporter Tol [Opitutaceae bacterium]
MQTFLRLFLLLGLVAAPAFAQGRIGEVVALVDKSTIPVRVSSGSADLARLARQAFGVHGRYKLVESGFKYDIRFSAAGPTQVRVDVLGPHGAEVVSQVVSGTTPRAALLRAADVAVEQTNEEGLRGFFAARLAFVGETTGKKEVYVSDLFLGELKRVTNDRAFVLTPRWSPDGQRLLYTSFFKSGFPDIFQYDLRTYERTTFVSFRGTNQGARYSPNGAQVAMVLSGEGSSEIYVGNAQGRQIARRNVGSSAVKASPCWSPDGGRIVFAMGDATPQLYVMPAGGGGAQRLLTGFSYAAEPDWSRAKPNRIACTIKDRGSYQIAVYDFSKGKAEKVSGAPFDGIEPCWLADGRHLVYTARDRATSVLCVLDTETGKSTPISAGLGGGAMQANVWTP